ncbi:glycosyltransferase [uncultured Lamprocystis sp.]|uniref:glycosyltransferase n=1 Tax=uncultured Lamprocystis sp. TaxID=543132 RepID=UPI0025F88E8F|nr:glycosyltransferase [uncultured Lamprocystis sp.]
MSHLALLLPELEAGGAQRVMLHLAREFAARGHRVDLVLLTGKGPLVAAVPARVRLVDLQCRNLGLGALGFAFSCVNRLAHWLRSERPDAMLSTITGANLVALVARERAGVAMRLAIREAVTLSNTNSALRRWAMRRLYPRADAVIALSSYMAAELEVRLGLAPERVVCIPNPVDVHLVWAGARQPLVHPWLDTPNLRVVIAAGRLIRQKDHATLLRAFALLPTDAPARLLVIGEGPERLALERLAGSLGIAQRVQLVGFDPNPWRWMARADLFVLSSRWEGHPNSLLEALVLGLPAVVTAYDSSIFDLAARHGLALVPPADPARLAQMMVRLLFGRRERRDGCVDEIDTAFACYLTALGVPDLTLSHAALDHKTAAAAK